MEEVTIEKKLHVYKVYPWCLSYLLRYKVKVFFILIIGMISSFVHIAIPKFIGQLIDKVLPENSVQLLLIYFLILIMLVSVVILLNPVRNILNRIVTEKSGRDLHLDVLDKLRHLGFSYYEKNPAGNTLSLFNNELGAVQKIYRNYFPQIIQMSLQTLLTTAILVWTSVPLSLVIIPCFLSYYLIGPILVKKQSFYARMNNVNRTEYNKKVYDSVSGILELKANNASKWDLNRMKDSLIVYRKTSMQEKNYAMLRGVVRRLTVNIGAIVLFIVGASLVMQEKLSPGEFVAFLLIYFTFMNSLIQLITVTTDQRMLLFQAEKVYEFMTTKPDVIESKSPQQLTHIDGNISFRNVSFRYNEEEADVLKRFNLAVTAGEKVALVGHSGSGKSTTLKLLGRFYDPQNGDITIDDFPIRELSFDQLRDSLGYVFQETYLFGMSIRDDILFGRPDASEEEIIEAAKAAHAHDFISEFPEGYDSMVGERGFKLSGGQKQRIAIARLLLKNPPIILLDEATSALDNISEVEVQQALVTLLSGRTTLAIAHRLSTIQYYDKIAFVQHGKIAELGSYDELMSLQGEFYKMIKGEAHEVLQK